MDTPQNPLPPSSTAIGSDRDYTSGGSSQEELRSAQQELAKNREELQAVRTEMSAANTDLRCRVEEIGGLNADLHNFIEGMRIPAIFLDTELRILRFTCDAVGLLNLLPAHIGRPVQDLRNELNYPELAQDAQQVLDRLIPVDREVQGAKSRRFIARVLPYRSTDDRLVGIVICLLDITELKAAQENKNFLAAIVESCDDSIVSIDFDGIITSWNAAACRLYGYTAEEAIHRPLQMLSLPSDLAKMLRRTDQVRQSEHLEIFEIIRVHKDGHEMWLSIRMSPIRDDGGKCVGVSTIARDITERKKVEFSLEQSRKSLESALEEAQAARAEAENANRAKDEFLAVVSHELRTPLTPVIFAAEMFSRNMSLPEEVRNAFDMINRNVGVQCRLIDDLLDFSSMAHGKMELALERIDVHEVVAAAVETAKPEFQTKCQKLSVTLAATESECSADAIRLRQAIWNLLRNASKFTPDGGKISLSTRNAEGRLLLIVSDTGIGIAPEKLGSIFDAFEQGTPEVKKRFGGLGLGLAIVRATTEAHGGTIHAESGGLEQGSTFTLSLPLRGSQDKAEQA